MFPDAVSDAPGLADGYLRCLLALGHISADEGSVTDLADAVTGLVVAHCADVSLAAVYSAEDNGQRAELQAFAGAAPGAVPVRHSLELPRPYEWPPVDSGDAGVKTSGHASVVALEPAPGTRALGWLWLEADRPATVARSLLAQGAARVLAAGLVRIEARERLRAEALEARVARRTEALAASEAQFKAISSLVPDLLWRCDSQGRMAWRSEQWNRFTGDDGSQPAIDYVHLEDRAQTQAWLRDTVAGRRLAPHEYRLRRHDGIYRRFIARMSPLTGSGGAIEHWFGSATDIERQQLVRHALETPVDEGTLAQAHAATLQQELLHRLARSQEDERRRIARDLHDSLGQYLTALKVALSLLAPAIVDPHVRGLVTRLDMLTTQVDRELDDIIAALRPVVLEELGLVGALPGIVAGWSRQSGIAAEALLVHVGDERFDDESEFTLYRVTQESLTNVVKHARARNVAVTLARHQDELHLTVEDDGVGFDVNLHGTGWGLRGMAERARSVGGLLQVESSPEAGTTVLVRLPCRPRVPTVAVKELAG